MGFSPNRAATTFLILAAFILCGEVSHTRAVEYVKPTKDTGELFGMEIEIAGSRSMSKIFDLFEIKPTPEQVSLIHYQLTTEDVDAYLTPSTLDALDSKIRERLTEGLVVSGKIATESKPIVKPKAEIQVKKEIVAPSRIILSNPVGINTSTSGIILPKDFQKTNVPSGPVQIVVDESVQRRLTWEKVIDRWKKMDVADRKKLIEVEKLSSQTKSLLMFQGRIPESSMILKPGVPAPVRDLFSRLNWNLEGGSQLEFRHTKPVGSPEQFHKDRELLSDLTGIRKYIDDPSLPVPEELKFSYHWHASRYGSPVREIVEIESRVRLIDLALIDRSDSVLSGSGIYGHGDALGPIKHVRNEDHFESRQHAESPRKEFERLHRWMGLSKVDAVREANAHLAARSKVLQDSIQSEISKGSLGRDTLNRLTALIVADESGTLKLTRAVATPTENRLLNLAMEGIHPQNVVAILPLIRNKAEMEKYFGAAFEATVRSPKRNAVIYLEERARKVGMSKAEIGRQFEAQLDKQIFRPDLAFEPHHLAQALKVSQTQHTFELLKHYWTNCISAACLNTLSEAAQLIRDEPKLISTAESEQLRQIAIEHPVFKSALEHLDAPGYGSSTIATFVREAGPEQAELLERIYLRRQLSMRTEITAMTKLLRYDRFIFDVGRLPIVKGWELIYPNEVAELKRTLSEKFISSQGANTAQLQVFASKMEIPLPKSVLIQKTLSTSANSCASTFAKFVGKFRR